MSDAIFGSQPAGLKQAHRRGLAARAFNLAAAPVFVIMALLARGGEPNMLCAAMLHVSPLDGMTPMYLLMAASHSGPWLRLILRSIGA